jgi:glycolate oxidase|tara:strand:- start:1748 stop:2884 length:1137 start_codon:yes stop_codon:yes gene_type:complete
MKKRQISRLKAYETDASRIKGKVSSVIFPKTVMEVREAVVRAERIVSRGGGSGFSGGAISLNGEDVILNLSSLDGIGNFDLERRYIEVEAGVILSDLQDYLEKYGLELPINLTSRRICTIGGMIATNAFGSRVQKYGRMANWIRWVEVVDGNGEVNRSGATELSDYVGMEGITGVIVKACLNLFPIKKRSASLFEFNTFEEVLLKVSSLKREQNISMIEFLDLRISKFLGLKSCYNLIVEYEGSLEGNEGITDYKYEDLMELLDRIYSVVAIGGYTRIEDIKILGNRIPSLIEWFERRGIPYFGHLGVGVIHPCFNRDQEKYILEMIKIVKRLGGQISGAYGIGLLKKEFVEINDLKIWTNVKRRTDPQNKFNIGKVI